MYFSHFSPKISVSTRPSALGISQAEDLGNRGGHVEVGHSRQHDAGLDAVALGDKNAVQFRVAGRITVGAEIALRNGDGRVPRRFALEGIAILGKQDEIAHALVLFRGGHAQRRDPRGRRSPGRRPRRLRNVSSNPAATRPCAAGSLT